MEQTRENIRKTGKFESPLREAVELLNARHEGTFQTSHKFGDTYIQMNGRNLLNATNLSNLPAETIADMAEKKINQ